MISLHIMIPYCSHLSGKDYIIYSLIGIGASLGGLGAGLYQLRAWLPYTRLYRERRKPSSHPHIVVCLSLANIVACLGTLLLCMSILITENGWGPVRLPRWNVWAIVSQIIANFGYIAAMFCTFTYLLDVLFQLHRWECMIEIYYLICWIGAFAITTLFQIIRYEHGFNYPCTQPELQNTLASAWLGIVLIFISLDVVVLLLLMQKIKTRLFNLTNTFSAPQHHMFTNIRMKFLLIVGIFVVCWTPTMLSACVYLGNARLSYTTELWFPEVLLNPLQECFNCFLFTPQRRSSDAERASVNGTYKYGSINTIQNVEGSVESTETYASHVIVTTTNGMAGTHPFRFTTMNGNAGDSTVQVVISQDSISSDLDYLNYSFEDSVHVGLVYGTS